ncbi:MAG: NADH-quinone oxidoreductase subunit NuoH [Proteobacteria bacterium]|nr:NADH-quinone oxidoreductase subunit NuoH [Pseudomonadota bacterium]
MGLTLNEFTVQLISTLLKFGIVVGVCLNIPPVMVWAERRIPAFMQRRKGPNRTGLFKWRLYGLMQSLADTVKLIFKEEVVPTGAQKAFYHLAPVFSVFPAIMIAMAIPYGPDIQAFGFTIPLSVVRVDVGFLFIFAVSSLAVYGVTIAGWASNNKYSLLGAIRASAQMISYEIPLGMSLIPIVLLYGSLDLGKIAEAQSEVWRWGVVLSPVSFALFVIAMFAETNRAPFDLAEAEGELVAGFHTEYTSAKFAAFFLGEYVSMFVLSCLASTVFFGGWQVPFFDIRSLDALFGLPGISGVVGFAVLGIKAAFFMWLYVWVRWTIPRFRYDQLMSLGWRYMIPIGLLNVVVTAVVLAFIRF